MNTIVINKSNPGKVPEGLAIFSGSFNPFHHGHLTIANVASKILGKLIQLEISRQNTDKPEIDYMEFYEREDQIHTKCRSAECIENLYVTDAPLFLEKAKIFSKAVFIIGADTLLGIEDSKNWTIQPNMNMICSEFRIGGNRFLVVQRKGIDISYVNKTLLGLCDVVPVEIYEDDGVSSTQIRKTFKLAPKKFL